MPSLFRLLIITGLLGGVVTGCLWILSTKYEPVQQEEVKAVPGVKIRKE